MNLTEEECIHQLISSMGIKDYDKYLLGSVKEYCRRLTTEILCDAYDIANHSNKKEISVEDVKLAIELKDLNVYKSHVENEKILVEASSLINQRELTKDLEKEQIITRYSKNTFENLTQRCFTYVPGSEAYPQIQMQSLEKEIDEHKDGLLSRDNMNVDHSVKNVSHSTVSIPLKNVNKRRRLVENEDVDDT